MNIAEESFQPFRSEYLTFKRFEDLGHLVKPMEDIVVDTKIKAKRIQGKVKSGLNEVELAIVPIKTILKICLELPEVFPSIKDHIVNFERAKILFL